MLDIKTSAVVLALLGVVVYETTSNSANKAQMEKQIDMLHDRVRLLSEAQTTTHDSVMLETNNRREAFSQLNDPAVALKSQIDLWERSDEWTIYFRDNYCQKIVAKTEADAHKIYNGISKDYAKIIWHDQKVIAKYGGEPWTLNCIQTAQRSHDIAQLEHSNIRKRNRLNKQGARITSANAAIDNNSKNIDADTNDIKSMKSSWAES
jgi:hypothetical protein